MESQVTFQAADGVPVTKRLDEVLVEAALMEANFGQYVEGMDLAEEVSASQKVRARRLWECGRELLEGAIEPLRLEGLLREPPLA